MRSNALGIAEAPPVGSGQRTEAEEAAKYAAIWDHPDYASFSPGEELLDIVPFEPPGSLVDLGCGAARATKALQDRGFEVTGLDLVDARETDVPFVQGCLWRFPERFDYGICTDVLEHLPTEYVMLALHHIASRVGQVFYSISNLNDHFGQAIGQPLHLTVKPFSWWKQHLEEVGTVVEARDLLHQSVFVVDHA